MQVAARECGVAHKLGNIFGSPIFPSDLAISGSISLSNCPRKCLSRCYKSIALLSNLRTTLQAIVRMHKRKKLQMYKKKNKSSEKLNKTKFLKSCVCKDPETSHLKWRRCFRLSKFSPKQISQLLLSLWSYKTENKSFLLASSSTSLLE